MNIRIRAVSHQCHSLSLQVHFEDIAKKNYPSISHHIRLAEIRFSFMLSLMKVILLCRHFGDLWIKQSPCKLCYIFPRRSPNLIKRKVSPQVSMLYQQNGLRLCERRPLKNKSTRYTFVFKYCTHLPLFLS